MQFFKYGKKETSEKPVRVRRRKCVYFSSKANRIALKAIGLFLRLRRRKNAIT
jgi:hypothetical protein